MYFLYTSNMYFLYICKRNQKRNKMRKFTITEEQILLLKKMADNEGVIMIEWTICDMFPDLFDEKMDFIKGDSIIKTDRNYHRLKILTIDLIDLCEEMIKREESYINRNKPHNINFRQNLKNIDRFNSIKTYLLTRYNN